MKRLILFTLIVTLTEQVFCQFVNDSLKSSQKDYYQQKTKTQKPIAWILPGGGAGRNKHKAVSLSFKKEKALVPDIRGLSYRSYPALSLKINLDNHK